MADQKLTKSRRLRRKSDIDRAFRRGRSASDRLLRLHARRTGLGESRLAVSCPRKLGSSVARSRWKRLIREAFRIHRERIGPGLDIVVVPLQRPDGLKRQDVEASMLAILERIGRRERS